MQVQAGLRPGHSRPDTAPWSCHPAGDRGQQKSQAAWECSARIPEIWRALRPLTCPQPLALSGPRELRHTGPRGWDQNAPVWGGLEEAQGGFYFQIIPDPKDCTSAHQIQQQLGEPWQRDLKAPAPILGCVLALVWPLRAGGTHFPSCSQFPILWVKTDPH